jgi:hypothetical protein
MGILYDEAKPRCLINLDDHVLKKVIYLRMILLTVPEDFQYYYQYLYKFRWSTMAQSWKKRPTTLSSRSSGSKSIVMMEQ